MDRHDEYHAGFHQLDDQQRSNYLKQVKLWIASALAAVPAGLRSQVCEQARWLVGSDNYPFATPFVAIPPDAPMQTAAHVVAGLGELLNGLLHASPSDTVASVIDTANAIATDAPIGGDPAEHPLLPSAAAVMLESGLRRGIPEIRDPEVVEALIAINDVYDCYQHSAPLGGGIWDQVKAWWKGNFGSDEEKVAYQQEKQRKTAEANATEAALSREKAITKLVKNGYSLEEATAMVDTPEADTPSSATIVLAPTAASNVDDGPETLDGAVITMKDKLKRLSDDLQNEKARAQNAATKLARLRWAQAVLDAPDDVAELMQDARPDWTTKGGALQTAVDLLSAAKQSGDVPTLKVFSRIMSALAKSRPQSAGWLDAILGGEPLGPDVLGDSRGANAAEGLAEYLKIKSELQDPFNAEVPPAVREEALEL